MSVTFYGKTKDGRRIALAIEHPAHVNLASANARTFLEFLRIEPGPEPSGEVAMAVARRAIMRARATFDRRVGGYTREGGDEKRPGRCRVIAAGIDAAYFERRLDDFEGFLDAIAVRGAGSICWE